MADDLHHLRRAVDADRDAHVLRAGERAVVLKHVPLAPLDELAEHVAHEDERYILQFLHLEQLPDHHGLQHRANAPRHDDECVGHQHEVVKPGEERAVLECLSDEGLQLLFERWSTRIPMDATLTSLPPARLTPSLAACIKPRPPPVTISQPRRVRSVARSRTARCTQWSR